jgi:hypothetical protein
MVGYVMQNGYAIEFVKTIKPNKTINSVGQ